MTIRVGESKGASPGCCVGLLGKAATSRLRDHRDRLQLCFELEESTSSSALLLSSIDAARRQFVRDGDILVERALEVAEHVREGVRGIDGIELVEVDHLLGAPGVAHADPTHVLIDVSPLGITGYQAGDFIRDEHQIDVELVDHRRLMALVSFGHDEDMADRLLAALHDLAEKSEGGLANETPDFPVPAALRTEQAMRPRDAFFAATRNIHVRDGAGEICAEIITPYPPGIPVLAPGEVITEPIIEYLREFVAIGGFLEGASDQTLEQIRVVARH